MSEWTIVFAVLWLACGVLGCWLANRRLDQRYPGHIDRGENAAFYLLAIGGVSTLLAALIYMLTHPTPRLDA